MLSSQWIAGVAAVIKVCLFPVLLRMAIAALLSIASCMYIIQQVAAMALLCCILVCLINMAAVAFQFCVFLTQSEVRTVMIEIRASPGLFCMAIIACFAEGALVDVIAFVAGHACSRGIPILFFPDMTGFTTDARVSTFEKVIGFTVIKGFFIQLDDICDAALVIGMAMTALGFRVIHMSMKTLRALYVCINFFMTVSTKRALFLLAERLVTFLTVFFVFCMPLYYLARHYQGFDSSSHCAMHYARQRGCHDSQENKNMFPHY